KSTRNRKDEEHHLPRTETRKAPCSRALADYLDLEAFQRVLEQKPDDRRRNERKDETPMCTARCAPDFRQNGAIIELAGFREIIAFGIAPCAAHQPVKEELCNIDKHKAGQDFVRVEAYFQ